MRPTDIRRLVILAEGEFGPHHAKTAYGVIRYGRDDVVALVDSTKAGENVNAYLPVYTRSMRPTDLRRLVILAEGEFGPHSAKTAYGVIRYGRDDVVAVVDSTKAGQNVEAYLPGHDIPIVSTLAEALALPNPPDALLIGIAPDRRPAAGRPGGRSSSRRSRPVSTSMSGLHTFLADDPEFKAAAAARGTSIVDYRRPPDRMETAVGRRHEPGQAGDPDRRHRLRRRQDVGRARAPARRPCGRRPGVVRGDRPDRDDDRGLGRGRRPARSATSPRGPSSGSSRRARASVTGSSSRARARSITRRTRR